MACHSKWTNIKHRKAVQDAKRGKLFTKIIRELVTAAKLSGSDIASNPRLRAAIDKALANNMTRNTLNRAIARGIREFSNSKMETSIYEGYGPGGIAVMVECLSDNRNRTVSEIRHAFTVTEGNLSIDGSVSYLFTKRGVISFSPGEREDTIIGIALEAGADDIITYDNSAIDVHTKPIVFYKVKDALESSGMTPANSEVILVPSIHTYLDAETAPKLLRLIDILEDSDDVQEVYHNVLRKLEESGVTVILGIDPGLCITGYGILRQDKRKLSYIGSGCIRTKVNDLASRLKIIYAGVSKIIDQFQPDCLAIEQIFMAKNANSALKLAQARGVAIVASINLDLPVFEYAARQVKQTIAGTGSAEKSQVQNMVRTLLTLSSNLQADAADALAIAITHCYIRQNALLMQKCRLNLARSKFS